MSPTPSLATKAIHAAFLRWAIVLGLVLTGDIALTLHRDLDDLASFAGGSGNASETAAGARVVLHIAVIAAVAGVIRAYYALRRQLYLCDQAIAAASTTSADWLWETDRTGRVTYSSQGESSCALSSGCRTLRGTRVDLLPATDEHCRGAWSPAYGVGSG